MSANRPIQAARAQPAGGFILLGVLVLVMLASMLVMSLLFGLRGEEAATAEGKTGNQAWLVCLSGVEEALRVAGQARPGTTDWRSNPNAFKDRFVYEDGVERWYFTIYGRAEEDALEPMRYGLTDEASKVNLNTATRDVLARVPGFDSGLLDALSGKREPTLFDAAPETLAPVEAVAPAPAPIGAGGPPRHFQTIGELAGLPGFNAAVVYGEDANYNQILDPNEDDGDQRPPNDQNDHKLDAGLSTFLTVGSHDPNKDNKGRPRTNLNDPQSALPSDDLPPGLTNYIAAIRKAGLKLSSPADLLEATAKVKDESGAEVEVASGVGKAELAVVMDLFTCSALPKQEGLINVNTASVKVLATLPGVDEPLAEAIASARRSVSPDRRTTTAWLLQEGALTPEQFKRVAPFVCARSFQFTFHVVGYSLPSGKYRVLEVGIETDGDRRVTSLRDLTRLGLPIRLPDESQDAEKTVMKNRRAPSWVSLPDRRPRG